MLHDLIEAVVEYPDQGASRHVHVVEDALAEVRLADQVFDRADGDAGRARRSSALLACWEVESQVAPKLDGMSAYRIPVCRIADLE